MLVSELIYLTSQPLQAILTPKFGVAGKLQRQGCVRAMFFVYGDDSADEKRKRVSAIGVVLGTEEMWNTLDPKWTVRNKEIPFHARDCESDKGDYVSFPHKENKTLYRDLATMLAESGLIGFGIAIDLVAQRKVLPDSLDLAYYKAFIEVLDRVTNLAIHYGEIAKLTFDISSENEYNAGLLYAICRENEPEMFEHLAAEISFVPAKEHSRVQVADLMAYEAMKALDNTVGPIKRTRGSWEALRATERFATLSYSSDWFTDLKRNLGELERKMRFKQQDYLDWLKDKRRQHSQSNLFHFMNWIGKRDAKKETGIH